MRQYDENELIPCDSSGNRKNEAVTYGEVVNLVRRLQTDNQKFSAIIRKIMLSDAALHFRHDLLDEIDAVITGMTGE